MITEHNSSCYELIIIAMNWHQIMYENGDHSYELLLFIVWYFGSWLWNAFDHGWKKVIVAMNSIDHVIMAVIFMSSWKLSWPLHPGALYFQADLSKYHLNINFHCIGAPNHPGKGSDPPNQANAPLNMDNSSQNKCPKPFGQGSRPHPPHLGNARIDPATFSVGLPLCDTI